MRCDNFKDLLDSKCWEQVSDKLICFEENKRKYEGKNEDPETKARKSFLKIKLDGCVFTDKDDQKRVDYMLIDCIDHNAYLIELKGAQIDKAVEQIEATLTLYQNALKGCTPHGRIVLTKSPTPAQLSSDYKKLERFLKEKNGNLKYQTSVLKENLYK